MTALTEKQRELLEDKLALWREGSTNGNMEMRDYNRRCAEALAAALSALPDVGEITRGNFIAVTTDEPQINNWHTAIYEDDYDGLLIAMCNQNGRYPWQVRAILAGLNAKREAADALTASPAARSPPVP